MPQPVRKYCKIDIGAALADRPEHAAELGKIVAMSGRLESLLGWMLAFFSRGSAKITIAMFHATTSTDAQRAMLLAAANLALQGAELDQFLDLMEDFRPRYGERNRLVHNLWGSSEDHQNKAIWCKTADASSLIANVASIARPDEFSSARGGGIWSKCMLYSVKDLKDVLTRLSEYTERVEGFLSHLITNHQAIAAALEETSDEVDLGRTKDE